MNIAPPLEILDAAPIDATQSLPLHRQVRQFLRGAIDEHFEDGQSFWTEMLLMERLGVSRHTVRQALDELTREGILVREASRRSFIRKTETTSVGMVFEQANSDFVSEMIQRLATRCLEKNLRLELYPLWKGFSPEELPAKIRERGVKQRLLLMTEGMQNRHELFDLLVELGHQIVSLDDIDESWGIPFVTTDSEMAVRVACEHLLSLGHRCIALMVNEPAQRLSVAHKIAEFERIVATNGLEDVQIVNCGTTSGERSFLDAYEAMPALWNGPKRPTAILTVSDPGAWAILRWCAEQKISIPGDVSVVGYEGVKPDAFTYPPLTTVAHALDDLAQRTLEVLWETGVSHHRVAPRLVLRNSTGPCP